MAKYSIDEFNKCVSSLGLEYADNILNINNEEILVFVESISIERPELPQRRMSFVNDFFYKQGSNARCFVLGFCRENNFLISIENLQQNVDRIDFIRLINEAKDFFDTHKHISFKRYNGSQFDATKGKIASVACIRYKDDNEKIDASTLCAYLTYFDNRPYRQVNISSRKEQIVSSESLQRIYYGAPGTGKSHAIQQKTIGQEQHRVTFHPDTDYANFVGCYKPTKKADGNLTYDFVPQAFVKAYVSAWKKYMGQPTTTIPAKKPITSITDNAGNIFTIKSIDDQKIVTSKDISLPKEDLAEIWNNCWTSGIFKTEGNWREPIKWGICKWMKNHIEKCTLNDFEVGWTKLLEELQRVESIPISLEEKTKKYLAFYESEDTIHILVPEASNTRKYIAKNYDTSNITPLSAKTCLQILLKQRDEENFDHAWQMLMEEFHGTATPVIPTTPESKNVFLIIEEINRGNCAQIFGDLFQLLDRNDNGFSDYTIEPDTDLAKYIATQGLNVSGVMDSTGTKDISDDINKGHLLMLPNNLYIWATMNTSDQSLFPMDSAFKRRWDWEYVPIKKENGIGLDWKIQVSTNKYDWWNFLEKINQVISKTTHSEDKQLGFFFCKADEKGIIDEKKFINKVIFYLWNDVFKDYGFKNPIFNDSEDKEDDKLTFTKFFKADASSKVEMFLKNLNLEADDPGVSSAEEDSVK